jgi:hypothetical protein
MDKKTQIVFVLQPAANCHDFIMLLVALFTFASQLSSAG